MRTTSYLDYYPGIYPILPTTFETLHQLIFRTRRQNALPLQGINSCEAHLLPSE